MPSVHEHVHQQASRQRKQQRHACQDVNTMLQQQDHAPDRQRGAKYQTSRPAQKAIHWFIATRPVVVLCHPLSPPSFARFKSSELPMTESELAVMAITPIIGCSRPTAATGMAARL